MKLTIENLRFLRDAIHSHRRELKNIESEVIGFKGSGFVEKRKQVFDRIDDECDLIKKKIDKMIDDSEPKNDPR